MPSNAPLPDQTDTSSHSPWREWMSLLFKDHGILRYWWTNFDEIAPGVYRSNHPSYNRLVRYKDMGIKTILNLRGTPKSACHRLEKAWCKELGLELVSIRLLARAPNGGPALLQLLDSFKTIEKPFVMHCKSGADRAGLASAFYLIAEQGADVATARKMLSLRYLHIKQVKTGVLDHVLDHYEARLKEGPITLRDWLANEYEEDIIRDSFNAKTGYT